MRGLGLHSAGTVVAVIYVVVIRHVADHGVIDISVVYVGHIHIGDRGVVMERAADPASAYEAVSEVAEAVVDASVESDVRTPVPGAPKVRSVTPAPVAGRP